jgi:predicted DNA-binding protein (MmcQ/YjbR family)
MNIESLRSYCLSLKGTTEDMPFGPDTLVFKVMGKMFALTGFDSGPRVNLKCSPDLAIELRERYPCVLPGYHMNKKHWNTVVIDGTVPENLITEWIDHSYQLVVEGLPKKEEMKLREL